MYFLLKESEDAMFLCLFRKQFFVYIKKLQQHKLLTFLLFQSQTYSEFNIIMSNLLSSLILIVSILFITKHSCKLIYEWFLYQTKDIYVYRCWRNCKTLSTKCSWMCFNTWTHWRPILLEYISDETKHFVSLPSSFYEIELIFVRYE